jgi:hypothetical protein
MDARLLNGSIPVYVPPQELKCRIEGVIDGPVRVIRDEIKLVKIGRMGLEMIYESFCTYYCNGYIVPVEANFPASFNKLFLDVDLYWAMALSDAAAGSTYLSEQNPRGIRLDGVPENLDDQSDNAWMAVTGPQGSLVTIVDWGTLPKEYRLIRTSLVD